MLHDAEMSHGALWSNLFAEGLLRSVNKLFLAEILTLRAVFIVEVQPILECKTPNNNHPSFAPSVA